MFKGVYKGKKADEINDKILILGESHYDRDRVDSFTTQSVLDSYKLYPDEAKYKFFSKIAKSFGICEKSINDEFARFWDYVYFGNYVDIICGIKTGKAKELANSNREKYNNALFEFINENDIKYVFVFSRLVYNKMPSIDVKNNGEMIGNITGNDLFVANKRDWISKCEYKCNCEHKHVTVKLNHNVTVYNMRHPSANCGYKPENYNDILSKVIGEIL